MNQLKQGIKVEHEHGALYDAMERALKAKGGKMPIDREAFFHGIAKAHVKEMPDYYTRLEKMERE